MLPGEFYEGAQREMLARDAEAANYDQKMASRFEKEVPTTLRALYPWEGMAVIDYGCGTGRISSELVDADVLGVDISGVSLDVFRNKKTKLKSLQLIQADATLFKTEPERFDRALSSQVYEHIPDRNRRVSFLKNVYESLKPKGVFVASVYHNDLRRRIKGGQKEGSHPSGIFFHYFNKTELEEEFREVFDKVSVWPFDITLPLEERLRLPVKIRGTLSRALEHIPGFNLFGHLLIVVAKKS